MSIRSTLLGLAALLLAASVWWASRPSGSTSSTTNTENSNANTSRLNTVSAPAGTTPTNAESAPTVNTNTVVAKPVPTIALPIADFYSRITKKPFGIYITTTTSPIQPEKFTGYHTGADAETTTAEKDIDIPVFSVVDGTVIFAGHVNGYGGVMIIRATIDTKTYTMLYGHLRISSFIKKVGQTVKLGEKIGVLGTGYSSETDGERKHLHFGIVKGSSINYKGYVKSKSALSAWEDPVAWLKSRDSF